MAFAPSLPSLCSILTLSFSCYRRFWRVRLRHLTPMALQKERCLIDGDFLILLRLWRLYALYLLLLVLSSLSFALVFYRNGLKLLGLQDNTDILYKYPKRLDTDEKVVPPQRQEQVMQ